MKPDKTPSEIISYITEILRERQSKELPTYYTISIEQYERLTPVAEKEEGYENFKQQMFKYLSDYNLSSITVQLFAGKSRNSKNPIQVFKIPLKKQTPLLFNGFGEKPAAEVVPTESSVPVQRHYDEKFELQMRIMRAEMEKQGLLDKVNHLIEKYEDKIKDTEVRNREKITQLQNEVRDLEQEIKEFEREIHRYEREKHNSFGNIALGSIGARIAENFARTDIGTGILKGVLGKEGFTQLQGHIQGTETNPAAPSENKEQGARIIEQTEIKETQQNSLQYLHKAVETLNPEQQKMLLDILEYNTRVPQLLVAYWNQLETLKNQEKTTP